MKKLLPLLMLLVTLLPALSQSPEKLIKDARKMNNARSWNNLAIHYIENEDSIQLKYCLEQSYNLALKEKNRVETGRSLLYKSEYDRIINNRYTPNYKNLKIDAIRLLLQGPPNDYLGDAYYDISKLYNTSGLYDSALIYLFKAKEEYTKRKVNKTGSVYCDISYANLYKGAPDSAKFYAKKAITVASIEKDSAAIRGGYSLLGIISRRENDYPKALGYYLKTLDLYKQQNNWKRVVTSWCNIAVLYTDWNKPDKAITFAEKAISVAQEHQLPNKILANPFLIMGKPLCETQQYKKAIASYLKALPYLETAYLKRSCLMGLTTAYYEENMRDSSRYYLLKLEELFTQSQATATDSYYLLKGKMAMRDLKYNDAIRYYEKVINLQKQKVGTLERKNIDCYSNLSLAYEKGPKDYKNALYYRNQAFTLQDSIYNKENSNLIADYYARFKTQEKEIEISKLYAEQKEGYFKSIIYFSGCVIIIILLISAVLYNRTLRLKKEKEVAIIGKQMEQKETEYKTLLNESKLRHTKKYIEGIETARKRLAAELHDDVCNSLLALEMKVSSLTQEMSLEAAEQIKTLATIRNHARNISHQLMPPVFQYATIDEILDEHLKQLALSSGIQIEYISTLGIDWNTIPSNICFEYYRVTQEAVTNAIKHALAKKITINLQFEYDQLSISIKDDGKGFDTQKKKRGIGLHTIVQRIESIKGVLNLTSEIGKGTEIKVSIHIPIQEKA